MREQIGEDFDLIKLKYAAQTVRYNRWILLIIFSITNIIVGIILLSFLGFGFDWELFSSGIITLTLGIIVTIISSIIISIAHGKREEIYYSCNELEQEYLDSLKIGILYWYF